jgi:hypothetical protein
MTCYDCGRDPCICRDIFPYSRERTADGKIYDHNGGLLFDPATEVRVPVVMPRPRTHCAVCGTRLRGRRQLEVGECRRCHK